MEASAILQADSLDIIFENRNKGYGAYELRKHYGRRLTKALVGMGSMVAMLLGTYFLMAREKNNAPPMQVAGVVNLEAVPEPPAPPPPVTPPPPKAPQVHTEILTPPLIKPDDQVDEKDKPPTVDELVDAKIGLHHVDGPADDGVPTPPVDERKAVVDAPVSTEDPNKVFIVVEIESKYPGGPSAWGAYLNRNLVYPNDAAEDGKQGTVEVRFIVDTEGIVSNVEAISGPEELRNAAVSVIRKSGKWEPAIQNGKKVKSYKRQPITFRLEG